MPTQPRTAPKRLGYREAVRWIAQNDDTDDLMNGHDAHPVTVCLVADLFGKDTAAVAADVVRAVRRLDIASEAR